MKFTAKARAVMTPYGYTRGAPMDHVWNAFPNIVLWFPQIKHSNVWLAAWVINPLPAAFSSLVDPRMIRWAVGWWWLPFLQKGKPVFMPRHIHHDADNSICLGTMLVLTEIFLHVGIYSCPDPLLSGLCGQRIDKAVVRIVFGLRTEFCDKILTKTGWHRCCLHTRDHKSDPTKQVRPTKNFVTIGNLTNLLYPIHRWCQSQTLVEAAGIYATLLHYLLRSILDDSEIDVSRYISRLNGVQIYN